jgi:malonate-semialdehyde dehydrogenase (acetylating)/methylmalonate-semialdehyde dehydrogenase
MDFKGVASMLNTTPASLPGTRVIDVAEAKALIEKGTKVFDVRLPEEFDHGHIPGSLLVPYDEASAKEVDFIASEDKFDLRKLPADKNETFLMYCDGTICWKSYKAAHMAIQNGWKNVLWFRGGLPAWKEAGLPDGVFNVVHGDKESVDALLTNPKVEAISFVGSTPIARYVYENGAKAGKRVQALGGAKNHMLVLPDADLDLVADSAVNAGFGSAGERCMAISVVVAVDPIGDALVAAVTDKMSSIKVGDGRRGCDMGPLVTKEHRDKVASYLDVADSDGASIVVDGRGVKADGANEGFWLGPSLVDHVPTTSRVYTEEIFGPVLSVVRVKTYEEGVALINAGAFGNGTAIFTNDGGAARKFVNDIQVGMVGVNVPIPVPVAYFSFGGWKHSLFGDSRAHGEEGFRFFTRQKVVTSRWLDPSHGGLNLGFPQN